MENLRIANNLRIQLNEKKREIISNIIKNKVLEKEVRTIKKLINKYDKLSGWE